MSKIICDVCGTKYPESAETCPICGYARVGESAPEAEAVLMDEVAFDSRPRVKGGRFSRSNVRKRNKDIPDYQQEEIQEQQEEELYTDDSLEEPAQEKSGTALNVMLIIVILALLALTGYIFANYFMPRILDMKDQTPSTTEVSETEEPTVLPVPCTALQFADSMPADAIIMLDNAGQMYLLNIMVEPIDTTDVIIYSSSDENVVTVNEEGRITAVGEGTAMVTATCGQISLECQVLCYFEAESTEEPTEAPTEEPTEAPTEPGVEMTVTYTFVNIRADAGTNYDKVGEYKKGDKVTIYEEKKAGGLTWGRTDDGWICMDYVG